MSSGTKTLLPRVDRHLLALSAAAAAGVGVVGIAQESEAAVVYSGTLNVSIPANFTGLYLNMETGGISFDSGAALPGWDINPWVSGGLWRIFPATGGGVVGTGTTATDLPFGTPINAGSTFLTGASTLLPNGSPTMVGLRLVTADTTVHFGWARITTVNGTTNGTLVDYGWETVANTSIGAGDGIPEPASLGLLAMGAVGLMRRRNRA